MVGKQEGKGRAVEIKTQSIAQEEQERFALTTAVQPPPCRCHYCRTTASSPLVASCSPASRSSTHAQTPAARASLPLGRCDTPHYPPPPIDEEDIEVRMRERIVYMVRANYRLLYSSTLPVEYTTFSLKRGVKSKTEDAVWQKRARSSTSE